MARLVSCLQQRLECAFEPNTPGRLAFFFAYTYSWRFHSIGSLCVVVLLARIWRKNCWVAFFFFSVHDRYDCFLLYVAPSVSFTLFSHLHRPPVDQDLETLRPKENMDLSFADNATLEITPGAPRQQSGRRLQRGHTMWPSSCLEVGRCADIDGGC